MLCYVLTWITGLIFFLLEKDSRFVKFHAMQAIITFVALFILSWIPFVNIIVGILALVLWILLMIEAYQGKKFKLPWVGDLAEKWSAS